MPLVESLTFLLVGFTCGAAVGAMAFGDKRGKQPARHVSDGTNCQCEKE